MDGTAHLLGANSMCCADPNTKEIRRFLTSPRNCEVTGVINTPDGKTMFVGIQHLGEDSLSANPTQFSNWPQSQFDKNSAGEPLPVISNIVQPVDANIRGRSSVLVIGTWGAGNHFAGIGDLSSFPTTTEGYLGTMVFDLGVARGGVGANFSIFNDGAVSGQILLEAIGTEDVVLESLVFTVDFDNFSLTNAALFRGFVRNTADIVALRVSGDGFVVDNLSAVPVPAALPLMLAGLRRWAPVGVAVTGWVARPGETRPSAALADEVRAKVRRTLQSGTVVILAEVVRTQDPRSSTTRQGRLSLHARVRAGHAPLASPLACQAVR